MLVAIVIVFVAWSLGCEAGLLSVGEFVHFLNIREKLFVSTNGQVQEILKGGVLVGLDSDSDICEVYVQVNYETLQSLTEIALTTAVPAAGIAG
jgi:hypothetical protein